MYKFKYKCVSAVFVVFTVVSMPLLAQNPQGMSEEQMQQMMQGMQGMADCFKKIDTSKLQAIAEEGKVVEKEIKQLCTDGKRDEAQQRAMTFGFKYVNSPEFEQIKECGTMAKGMMPDIPDYSVFVAKEGEKQASRHVCD